MTNNPLARLSVQQLKQALTIREKIDTLQKDLDRIIGDQASTLKGAAPRKRGKLSAAGRARISAAAKARWAKIKARRTKK